MTTEQLLHSFLSSPSVRRLSPSSRRDKASVVRRVVRWADKDPLAVTTADIERWLDATGPYTDETRTTFLVHLNSFYAWATKTGLAEENPVTPLRCHRRTLEEWLAPASAADEPELRQLARLYVAERLRRAEISRGTASNVVCTLEGFCETVGDVAPADLTDEHVNEWLATRATLAPATRRKNLSDVKNFCGWLARRRYVAVDPSAEVRPIRLPRYLPRGLAASDVGRLLAVCPDERARLIVLLEVQQGLRACEVARLEYADIHFSERTWGRVATSGSCRSPTRRGRRWRRT